MSKAWPNYLYNSDGLLTNVLGTDKYTDDYHILYTAKRTRKGITLSCDYTLHTTFPGDFLKLTGGRIIFKVSK